MELFPKIATAVVATIALAAPASALDIYLMGTKHKGPYHVEFNDSTMDLLQNQRVQATTSVTFKDGSKGMKLTIEPVAGTTIVCILPEGRNPPPILGGYFQSGNRQHKMEVHMDGNMACFNLRPEGYAVANMG